MKTVWSKANKSDFKKIVKDTTILFEKGMLSDGNAFFSNDVLRYFIQRNVKNSFEHTKNNLFINFLANARKYSPGTEVVLADLISNKEKRIKDLQISRVSSDVALEKTLQQINNMKNKLLFKEIVNLMGTSGRVHVTEEPVLKTELIMRDKYRIRVGVDNTFAKMINFSKDVFDFCHVCVIEGAPSSVSEINTLLNYCHEKNMFLLLLGRSFPIDVINTLAVNWQRKKLRVLPVVYGNSIYNLNAHADLCAISGATPINTATGHSLNGNLADTFGSLTNLQVGLQTVSATANTDPVYLVKSLKTKLSKLDIDETDKREIILNRLAGLSPKTLHVKIAQSPYSWQTKNEIEIALSIYNGFCQQATIITYEDGSTKHVPTHIYKKAKNMHNVYNDLTKNIGGYIVHEETKPRTNNR